MVRADIDREELHGGSESRTGKKSSDVLTTWPEKNI